MLHLRDLPLGRSVVFAALTVSTTRCFATDISDVYSAAIDQPRVNVQMRLDPAGEALVGKTLDVNLNTVDTHSYEAYLDTGASGYLIANDVFGYSDSTNTYVPGYLLPPAGLNPTLYPQRQTYADSANQVQQVLFQDVGAVGSGGFNVSQPIYLSLSNYPVTDAENNAVYRPLGHSIKAQVGPVPVVDTVLNGDLASILAGLSSFSIVGMPAMQGKVLVMDNRPLKPFVAAYNIDPFSAFNPAFISTYLYDKGTPARPGTLDTDPGIVAPSRTVKLTMVDFSAYTQTTPGPAYAPDLYNNPIIGPSPLAGAPDNGTPKVKIAFTPPGAASAQTAEGSFLLDTGAAASMISTHMASLLGITIVDVPGTDPFTGDPITIPDLRYNNISLPGQFTLDIQGIGGTKKVAGFNLDSLLLRTGQGNPLNDNDPDHIRFLDAPVIVNDVIFDPVNNLSLDGIFGMNFLTGSAPFDSSTFIPAFLSDAPFDWVTFDEQAGTLGLQLAGVPLAASVPEPSGLLLVVPLLVAPLRRRRRALVHFH